MFHRFYSYSQMALELEIAVAELERIAERRKYMRGALLEIVDELVVVKERVEFNQRWSDFFKIYTVKELVYELERICEELEELWMRRRRMREALIEVGYQLDYVNNKMKCNLMAIK